jgi:glyoxylase-like metal-dependent hydrolase (beta-lactamase superfamily II)
LKTSNEPYHVARIAVATLVLGLAQGLAAASVPVETVQLADGVYQFITAPDGYVPNGNCVAVINENDVLVFDTFTRPSSADEVVAEIRKITPKPVRYVVNSHWHPDHWSGNEVFVREFPGVEIIASEETRQFMLNIFNAWPELSAARLRADQAAVEQELSTGKSSDGTLLSPEDLRKAKEDLQLEEDYTAEALKVHRTYPTLTFGDELTLYHGGREFRLLKMVGDARGEIVLYLPQEKILIAGDVISGPVPYYTPPLSEHAASLRRLAEFDVAVIVPGHGPAQHDKSYLNLELKLLDSIVTQVRQAAQQGKLTVEDVQKAVDVEALRPEFTHNDKYLDAKFRRYVKGMTENAYREARDGKKFDYQRVRGSIANHSPRPTHLSRGKRVARAFLPGL